MERRDSKKNNGKQRPNKDKGGKSTKTEDGEDERKGKGLVRTKPCREIYRPPSMRKGRNRTNSTGSNHDLPSSSPPPPHNNFSNQNSNSNNNRNSSNYGQTHPISPIARPSSGNNSNHHHHHHANGQNNHNNQNLNRSFNVHAKEFQFSHSQPQSQPLNPFFGNGSPILASSGCYPLSQSKSSGNVNVNNFYQLWNQQQSHPTVDQALGKQQQQRNQGQGQSQASSKGISEQPSPSLDEMNDSLYAYRLQQSKSSGSISMNLRQQQSSDSMLRSPMRNNSISGGKTVRFDFPSAQNSPTSSNNKKEEIPSLVDNRFNKMKRDIDFAEQSFSTLKLDDISQSKPQSVVGNRVISSTSSPQILPKFRHPHPHQQQLQSQPQSIIQPQPQPLQLQKSRTAFLYPQQPNLGIVAGGRNVIGGNNNNNNNSYPIDVEPKEIQIQQSQRSNPLIRRSRSFGVTSRSNPNQLAQSNHSIYTPNFTSLSANQEFDLSIWPKNVQESVNSAWNGDRVPARARIEMVARIFNCILGENEYQSGSGGNISGKNSVKLSESKEKKVSESSSNHTDSKSIEDKGEKEKSSDAKDSEGEIKHLKNGQEESKSEADQKTKEDSSSQHTEEKKEQEKSTVLITSAVNIFLYFIQREKDRTVVESVVNTCFDTFQRIQKISNAAHSQSSFENMSERISNKWISFLQFLSSMYTSVKVLRLQKVQQPTGLRAMDELNYALLVLLCDSCLVTLRSPFFQTSKTMDALFQIMTSIGRDMENTFPLKMKQILASVRDALLGIKPYSNFSDEEPPPNVQKCLMQLIELHAANWSLPYNALKYYYNF